MNADNRIGEDGRIRYIDLAKGIGILLVVWYHIATPVDNLLNLFFMPLFFFLSGVCFNTGITLSDFFTKKSKRLLFPLIIGAALGILLEIFVYNFATYDSSIKSGFYNFWLVGNVPLWFLLTLFYTMTIVMLIEKSIRRQSLKLFIYAVLSAIGFSLSQLHIKNTLFLGHSLLILPFFIAGYCSKNILAKHNWANNIILIICLALLAYKGFDGIERTNIHQFVFHKFYYSSILLGFAGVYTILWLSHNLSRHFELNWLQLLGRSTMYILVLHYLIVHPLLPYFFDSKEHPYKYAISFILAVIVSTFCASIPKLKSIFRTKKAA
ncbi:MAG: acyltransferase [Muribaculaceae bacterium]|nr:acyltransferase [Muribaculaceae bacterium]